MQQHGNRGSPPPLTLPPASIATASSNNGPPASLSPQQQQPAFAFVDTSSPAIPGSQMSIQEAVPPSADPTPQEADALRAGALQGLSSEERDQALADVHGVSSTAPTDNEFIANRLSQLDQAISDSRSKAAYLRAKVQSPVYVSNRVFRLQFLLADSFVAQAASERLVSYFESKLVLFGPDKLTKDLTLEDLEAEDIKCLEHGVVQRLVGKDHAGRVVVSCWPTTRQEPTITIQNKRQPTPPVESTLVPNKHDSKRRIRRCTTKRGCAGCLLNGH
mmetsp:Transcript_7006/g.12989  ORF Transcript_7006/g.12989 Transcript_7006/m.12989 type:complete len:275 (+) Transcript_7006:115-939(+)